MDWRQIARIESGRSRRSSSYDKTGANEDYVSFGPGESFDLIDVEGPAVIRHIWITIDCKDPLYRRNLVLRAYWEDSDHPSVESPIGEFFGNGWGEHYNFSSPFLACAPRTGRGLVCYFPMPFRKHGRITIENQGDYPVERLYYYVDYELVSDMAPEVGLFHAWYNQELTQPENAERDENEWSLLRPYGTHPTNENNYLILATEGAGHFAGINYYVNNPGPMWYGEGDDMFLIDGEPWPGLHGTGTEDYFNTSWSPDEHFQHPAFGFARLPGDVPGESKFGWMGRTHCYRFHHLDPVRFSKSLHVSIEHGHDNCLTLDLATVAYWYQDSPAGPFPPLPSAQDRIPRSTPTVSDVHRWRDAFLRGQNPPVWGNF